MSTLNTNTIQGVNDPNKVTLPTTVTVGATILTDGSAGSTTITAEGGTNATNLQSGLLKAWDFYDGGASGAATYGTSFNIGSTTDNGTGDYTKTYTTAMATAGQYGAITSGHRRNGGPGDGVSDHATASCTHNVFNDGGSAADQACLSLCVFGDLA